MKLIRECILAQQPKSLKVAIAFHKKVAVNLHYGYFADYIGFLIPDFFIIGFGMDYNEHFRDLPHICSISKHAIANYSTS